MPLFETLVAVSWKERRLLTFHQKVLYPKVEEFAMLSEMVARRLALDASPATLALREEEIVIGLAFLSQGSDGITPRPTASSLTAG